MIKKTSERGQSIVIIAVMFLGLIAMAALIIDGGSLYLNRRNAQTAADSAALAGARELCVKSGSDGAVQTIVTKYVTANGAVEVDPPTISRVKDNVTGSIGSVGVRTTVATASFFARMLGYQNNTVVAEASAGCFIPAAAKNLLPISWACQPPVGGSLGNCSIHSIPGRLFTEQLYPTYENQIGENNNPNDVLFDEGDGVNSGTYVDDVDGINGDGKMAYLIMDSSGPTTAACLPPIGSGTIVCDFNGDGIEDLSGGGDRGWLALDGTGARSLTDLILGGYTSPVSVPQWFPRQPGAAASVFLNAKGNLEGKVVMAPVYNAYCLNTTAATLRADCNDDPADLIAAGSGSATYYRVVSFAPFVVTCISSKPAEKCPAKTYAGLTTGPLRAILTIEGYFVSGYSTGTGIDPGGFDLGVYVISLSK